MARKKIVLIVLAALILLVAFAGYHFLGNDSGPPNLLLFKAVRREIRMVVSTNGIIEPVGRSDIFAPIDGRIADLHFQEGAAVDQGRLLMTLASAQILTSLSEARVALLQARRDEQVLAAGPPKEETTGAEAAIAENALQLRQRREELRIEEELLARNATTREAVETLRKQIRLLDMQAEGLKARQQALMERHTPAEKQLVRERVRELARDVELLEEQRGAGSIYFPVGGILYSLPVKLGEHVSQGQLLAQVYSPGRVQVRAYVDEPDLGGIAKGERVEIEWDGLPDRRWTGAVVSPAGQVVGLGNRSVGYVICSIDDEPRELIPNINVKVQIVIASKPAALVVPRTAVFNDNGTPTVLLSDGVRTSPRKVVLGLVTPEEIEIVQGIQEGDPVVTNPGEVRNQM